MEIENFHKQLSHVDMPIKSTFTHTAKNQEIKKITNKLFIQLLKMEII